MKALALAATVAAAASTSVGVWLLHRASESQRRVLETQSELSLAWRHVDELEARLHKHQEVIDGLLLRALEQRHGQLYAVGEVAHE